MARFVRAAKGARAAMGAVELARGERVLASTAEPGAGDVIVATTFSFALVSADGIVRWRRPWLDVDSGSWTGDEGALIVTWMDGSDPARWEVTQTGPFLAVFRERVQASVVMGKDVEVDGRRVARAVLRKDLATGGIVEQVRWRRGFRAGDDSRSAVEHALARLRDDVGLR